MSGTGFHARRIGRQWQIWKGETFYCLAYYRNSTKPITNEADAKLAAARCQAALDDAAQWAETVRIHRLQDARAYLERRKARACNLSLHF